MRGFTVEQRKQGLEAGWRGWFTPSQRRWASLLVLLSGLQLQVLGESPPGWHCPAVQLKAPVSQPLGPTCSCSESPSGHGRGCSWELWGLRWALCSCDTFSHGVTDQRMFTWRRHLSHYSICPQIYCCSPQTNPF